MYKIPTDMHTEIIKYAINYILYWITEAQGVWKSYGIHQPRVMQKSAQTILKYRINDLLLKLFSEGTTLSKVDTRYRVIISNNNHYLNTYIVYKS